MIDDKILTHLKDGWARTLIEIARAMDLNREELGDVLEKWVEDGRLSKRGNRKRSYYYMTPKQVKDLSENFDFEVADQPKTLPKGMKFSRHCYQHLAGYVGVQVTEAMVKKSFLIPEKLLPNSYVGYQVMEKGWEWFKQLGIDREDLVSQGGRLTKQCLDFSERKNHLGGKLGDAFLSTLLEKEYVQPVEDSREIRFTELGKEFLEKELDLGIKINNR